LQDRAGQPSAPRALLAAVLVAIAALILLPRAAQAQDCPVLQPDCSTSSTSSKPTTPTTHQVIRTTTSTTEEESTDSGSSDEETSTTERRRTTTTEVVTTTTYTVTTLHNVLIPGDGSAGAESTTTTAPQLTTGKSGISDETLILVIVAGLGVVAVVAAILTYRYWSATKPRVVADRPQRGGQRSALLDGG
jgi:hypothetical protein